MAALYYNLMRMVHDNPEQALNVLIEQADDADVTEMFHDLLPEDWPEV